MTKLIDAAKKNLQYMELLKRRIEMVAPFLGAGSSKPYGFDLWPEFLSRLLERPCRAAQISDEDKTNIEKHISSKNYMSAAEKIDDVLPNINAAICHEMANIADNNDDITKESMGILGEYLKFFPSQTFITTNYDETIEQVLHLHFGEKRIRQETAITPFAGLKRHPESSVVYHMHGVFTDPRSIIFSSSHYDEFYGSEDMYSNIKKNRRRMRRFLPRKLSELYNTYIFLFIGCGMAVNEDRMYRLLREESLVSYKPFNNESHFALLNKDDFEDLQGKELELLTLTNIRPIWYSAKNDEEHEQAKKELFDYILSDVRRNWETKKEEEVQIAKIRQEREKERAIERKKITTVIETFPFPKKYYGILDADRASYELALVKIGEKYYLTDQGKTYDMLDKIFELKEFDVLKNLFAIMNEYGVKQDEDNNYIIEMNDWDSIPENKKTTILEEAKYRLFSCVSFMDAMRIFYT